MDSGISTVRNLLYIVLVLAVLSIAADGYVGVQLSQNSDELARLSVLLQKQLMTSAVEQSQQLQEKMDRASQQMDGMDQKMQDAQDKFSARMNRELPPLIEKTMDNYIRTRAPQIERQAMKQMPH
jgi:uncharacterized protein HemX